MPHDVWAARWEAWINRPESQKYDTWTPSWVPAGPNPVIERLARDNPRGVSVENIMNIPRADSDTWCYKPTKKCPYCKSIIDLPWKICPRCDRSLTETRPAAVKKVRVYSTEAIKRSNMRKCEKSAYNKKFSCAADRLRKDPGFCANIVRDGPGRYPDAFVQLAIACLALFPQAADASVAVNVTKAYSGTPVLAQYWVDHRDSGVHALETYRVSYLVTLFAVIAVAFFFMGCSFRCCTRRLARGFGAFIMEAPAAPNKPKTRTVGTMSQCTYTWDSNAPRFKADNQGFRRAGEVTIEF